MCSRLALASWFLSTILVAQDAALRVQPDAKNHVAAALPGAWQRDAELTKRLGNTKAPMAVTIREDHRVVDGLPAAVVEHLRGRRIYSAGTMRVKDNEQTFVLTEAAGTPEIFVFRTTSADPVRGGETLRVMLVRGAAPGADLLFLNGAPEQPFAAFARVPEPGQLEPAAALIEMARLLETGKHVDFLKTWCLPEDLARLLETAGSIEAAAEKFGGNKSKETIEMLLVAAKLTPRIDQQADEAIFEGEGLSRRVRLKRIAGRWYLCNR